MYLFIKKRVSQGLIYQKTCKNVQKRAYQMFLDPIQKRALSRSVHLEAVYLKALLYFSNRQLSMQIKLSRNIL